VAELCRLFKISGQSTIVLRKEVVVVPKLPPTTKRIINKKERGSKPNPLQLSTTKHTIGSVCDKKGEGGNEVLQFKKQTMTVSGGNEDEDPLHFESFCSEYENTDENESDLSPVETNNAMDPSDAGNGATVASNIIGSDDKENGASNEIDSDLSERQDDDGTTVVAGHDHRYSFVTQEEKKPRKRQKALPRFKQKGSSFRSYCGRDPLGKRIYLNFNGPCIICQTDISTFDLAFEHIKQLLGPSFKPHEMQECLKISNNRHRKEMTALKCPICTKPVAGEKDVSMLVHLKRHIIAVHEEKVECEKCVNSFPSMMDYVTHLPQCRERKPCKHCGKLFLNVSSHMPDCFRKTTGKDWKCPDCDFVSLSMSQYYKHRQEVHLKYSRSCEKCGKTFTSSSSWGAHQQTCEKTIARLPVDGWHSSLVGEFCCKMCDFKSNKTSSLAKHVETVHENYSKTCSTCGESFSNSLAWKNHCHNLDEKDKQYVCDECGKSFKSYGSIWFHRRSMHENLNRFQCTHCNRKFKHRQLANRHAVVHSDLKPYECSVCGSRFSNPGVAREHGKDSHGNAIILHKQKKELQILSSKIIVKIAPEEITEPKPHHKKYKKMPKVSIE